METSLSITFSAVQNDAFSKNSYYGYFLCPIQGGIALYITIPKCYSVTAFQNNVFDRFLLYMNTSDWPSNTRILIFIRIYVENLPGESYKESIENNKKNMCCWWQSTGHGMLTNFA